jgi:RNA polymerase sigma-70 factor, ECF subfamily
MNVELVSRAEVCEWDRLLKREAIPEPDARFALLVERESRFVFRIAYVVLRNVEDAEDIVQDTFFKLFRSGAWKKMENEKGFLARVAWRLAISRVTAKRFGTEAEPREIACGASNPERAAIESEWSRTIHRLIDALPEKLRRPLALSSIEEMTAAEIAAVMGLPEGTVRRLLMEARALVKEKMVRIEGRHRA